MMSQAKMTMLGLQRYLAYKHDTIFAELSLPTGIDRETVENSILDYNSSLCQNATILPKRGKIP